MSKFNPYGAPTTPGAYDTGGPSREVHIAALPVSDSWKSKFFLIEKAGGLGLPHANRLTSSERFAINFNFLACLFWPLYYFFKGMWKKGFLLVSIAVATVLLLAILMEGFGLGRFSKALGYATGAVFAMRANMDYYKKWVRKENDWI